MKTPSTGPRTKGGEGQGTGLSRPDAGTAAGQARAALRRTHHGIGRLPYEHVALVLQGGGALGAYQAGVYEAFAEAEIEPNWFAGISIGAINAAIMAGNAPADRVGALRSFWEGITAPTPGAVDAGWGAAFDLATRGTDMRRWMNGMHAAEALMRGAPGFFEPRMPPPFLHPPGSPGATSYYDTAALRATLLAHVDFDRINRGEVRLSLGAVNVRSGNFICFDSRTDVIRPEHVMASGALPPGFPTVEIEGEHYWDGGLVSNTPLQWVAQHRPFRDTIAFQIDLWSARGQLPRDLSEVTMRQKEIQYSSRTRFGTDQLAQLLHLRAALRDLLGKVRPELLDTPEARLLAEAATDTVFRVVHLIYRSRQFESDTKDYEFSRRSMQEHWQAGYQDAVHTLRDPAALERPADGKAVAAYDLGEANKI
jgi:NTE family protein